MIEFKTLKELKKRWNLPTPSFWKKVQTVGIMTAGLGIAIASAPIGLVTLGGYLFVSGNVVGILSQLTIKDNDTDK